MPQDHDELSSAAGASAPAAADFDAAFSAVAASPGIRRVWELAEPDLPPQVEPFSFVSAGMLRHGAGSGSLARADAGRPRMRTGRPRPVARQRDRCLPGGSGF